MRRNLTLDTAQILALAWSSNDSLRGGAVQSGDTLFCADGSSLLLECACLSFRHGEQHRLRYQMEGLETVWSLAPTSDVWSIRYSALPYGEYRLLVQSFAENGAEEGLQSAQTFVLTVIVPTPWYHRWFVRLAALLFLLLSVSLTTRHVVLHRTTQRLQREREEREKEQEKEQEKERLERLLIEFQLKTLRLQMDPHFIFNALMLLQELTMLDTMHAIEFIGVFADMLRHILQQADRRVISVQEELAVLRCYLYLEGMRYRDTLTVEILCTPDENSQSDVWNTKMIPPFLVQPFLENAIRHGVKPLLEKKSEATAQIITHTSLLHHRAPRITVRFRDEGTYLYCEVEDNGIGRAASAAIQTSRYANKATDKNTDKTSDKTSDNAASAGAADTNGKNQRKHLSIATGITQERLQLLQGVHTMRVAVVTDDLFDDNGTAAGTCVRLHIPYSQEQDEDSE